MPLSKRFLLVLPAVAVGLVACGQMPATSPAAVPTATAPAAPSAPAAPPAAPPAAAATPPAAVPAATVFTPWRIVQARSEPLLDFRRARLEFLPSGQLVGHTSCNTMSAPYTLTGERLNVGAVVTTRMACGPLLLEQEDRILTALELAATARVRADGLLELRDAEGRGVLRAVRADLPE